jgi:hypothetical protein
MLVLGQTSLSYQAALHRQGRLGRWVWPTTLSGFYAAEAAKLIQPFFHAAARIQPIGGVPCKTGMLGIG